MLVRSDASHPGVIAAWRAFGIEAPELITNRLGTRAELYVIGREGEQMAAACLRVKGFRVEEIVGGAAGAPMILNYDERPDVAVPDLDVVGAAGGKAWFEVKTRYCPATATRCRDGRFETYIEESSFNNLVETRQQTGKACGLIQVDPLHIREIWAWEIKAEFRLIKQADGNPCLFFPLEKMRKLAPTREFPWVVDVDERGGVAGAN